MRNVEAKTDEMLVEETILSVRQVLKESLIIEWLLGRRDRVVGHIGFTGHDYLTWLQTYILEQTGFQVTHSNLSIHATESDGDLICGWLSDTEPPESIPALESIAPWFPEIMEWIQGEDEDDPIEVTGQDVLDWIAEHK